LRALCGALLQMTLCFGIACPSIAQDTGAAEKPAAAAPKATVDDIQRQIKKTGDRIDMIQAVRSDRVAAEFGVDPAAIAKRLFDLGALKSAYERLLNALTALEKIAQDQRAIKEKFETYRAEGMAQPPPYTLTFLDAAHEELSTAERNQKNLALTVDLLRRELAEHAERNKPLQKELRKHREALETAAGAGKKAARWAVDGTEIQLHRLEALVDAKTNEILRTEQEMALAALQVALLKEQIDIIQTRTAYSDDDLKHQLENVEKEKADLQAENRRLRKSQTAVERKWLQARQDYEKAPAGDPRSVAEAVLRARDEWRRTTQAAIELNEKAGLLLDRRAQAWQKRYALVKGDLSPDAIREMRAAVENDLAGLGQTLHIEQNTIVNLQKQMGAIESRLGEEGLKGALKPHLYSQLEAIRNQLDRRLTYQSAILSVDQVEKRLFGEIRKALGAVSIKDHISDFKDDIVDFWNIEIWAVDNQPVTLRKVATALIILVLGLIAAKFILSLIRTRFLLRSQFKETTASAVHKILSYAAYLLVFLFALRMVNIPLTAFAFLGGAVAIGIGFGAQNLINNFISGFMILGERPINIGDLIEVDGVLGMVEEIGARCTRVRTGENIHILVPNSAFLEKNIINWTLSDQKIRTNITVGVAYGSPVKAVHDKLIAAVRSVDRVLKEPAPFALFSDFGDNALVFNVYFWVGIRRVIERRQIESDVRFAIDDLFAREGIVIAFPQRDVHLDSANPIRISLSDQRTNG
jgi:potassium efflux system protein